MWLHGGLLIDSSITNSGSCSIINSIKCVLYRQFRFIANFLSGNLHIPPGTCRCGTRVAEHMIDHVLGCKKYRRLWFQHDSVTSVVKTLATDVGLPAQIECKTGSTSRR